MDPVLVPVGIFATMALFILVFCRSKFTTVAVCTLLVVAAGASVVCSFSATDFLTCVSPSYFVVLIGFCITLFVGLLQDDGKRSRARSAAFEDRWRQACHVLDDGHEHEGGLIRGTYEGHSVQARASYVDLEPHASPISVYEVSVRAEPGRRRWSARPRKVGRSWRHWEWVVVARPEDLKKRLAGAGILEALHAQPEIGVGGNPKISYDPAEGTLKYSDDSGSVPDADTLRCQIRTLIALDAINSEHNVGTGTSDPAR
jgi:hypothetical protein